ncbi:C2 family cysteine protease [Pseudofrankia sp. BMG5.37]|uniref:C2 family cysteine protease n=1 Tax=Pseudofrankia sp. BMG5.37 TaxID=3050035 RepID=UPI0028951EE3|nr:C2 family cysteine protease [Pseudofrankia sp. BMG5.37]MDT3446658.1 C2 family cysteine protease [Pseudofrankia sp. BMG5.37]
MPSGYGSALERRAPAALGSAAAELRAAALELRGLAATASGLLDPVLSLDTPETWSSPWQRRATARVDGWLRALGGGVEAMAARARWYIRAADAFEAAAAVGPTAVGAGGAAGEGGAGDGAGPPGAPHVGLVPRLPEMPPGWDIPDTALLRELATGTGTGSADPFLAGPLGAGGWQGSRPSPSGDAWAVDVWAGVGPAGRGVDGGAHGGDLGGGGPVSFDPGLLGALAGRLRAAGTAAVGLATAVGRTDETALDTVVAVLGAAAAATGGGLAQALGAAVSASPPGTFRLAGLPTTTDVLRLGAHAVAVGGPDLAAAIERRTAHFVAAEEAVRAGGVLIDPRAWFDDAPPPSLGWIRTAAAGLVALVGTDPGALSAADMREVGRRLAALPPAAREAVVSRLRGQPLQVLTGALARLLRHVAAGSDDELEALAAVPDLLLASAPAAMLTELVRLLPVLEPAPPGTGTPSSDGVDVDEANRADPVVRDGVSTSDVGQGGLGDCYLAAVLIGLARQRPDLLVEGIRENPNGTLTVTFYRDGRPFPVTVTRALPGLPTGDAAGGAGGGGAGGARPVPTMAAFDLAGRPELWAAVYEKAYARLYGGYDAINGGDPGAAATDLTGHPHRAVPPGSISVAGVASRLAAGDVITVSTRPGVADEPAAGSAAGLVGQHAYTVLAADVAGGRLLLRNPWSSPGEELARWYRWDELRSCLRAVTLTPTS